MTKTFIAYRPHITPNTHNDDQANPPNEPQFEGVVFKDGKCVIHWLTSKASISVFDSFEDMMAIHGHPEYGTLLVWGDNE
jgi:hypothetical protein